MTKAQVFEEMVSVFQLSPDQIDSYLSKSFDEVNLEENEQIIDGKCLKSSTYFVNSKSWQEKGTLILSVFNGELFSCQFSTTADFDFNEILDYAISNHGFVFQKEEILPLWSMTIFRKEGYLLSCSTGALNKLQLSKVELFGEKIVEMTIMPPSPS